MRHSDNKFFDTHFAPNSITASRAGIVVSAPSREKRFALQTSHAGNFQRQQLRSAYSEFFFYRQW